MHLINPQVHDFIEDIVPPRKSPLDKMEKYARENKFPIIGPLVGTLLKQLAVSIKAKSIFELGSGFGYSALWMAQVLPSDGKIYLTDRKEENHKMAVEYFSEAGTI